MRKRAIYILITLLLIIIVTVLIIFVESHNPLRKSQDEIRESMLELTPIGMSMDDVLKVINSNKEWETMYVSYENGYLNQEPKHIEIIGEKSARVIIGRYREFFVVSVTVSWGFDENSKLIDIYVEKTSASL